MIVIYGAEYCNFCQKAKELAESYGIPYVYKDITDGGEYYLELNEKVENFRTIPQIWMYNKYIGGYNDLVKEIEETNVGNYGQGAY